MIQPSNDSKNQKVSAWKLCPNEYRDKKVFFPNKPSPHTQGQQKGISVHCENQCPFSPCLRIADIFI